MIEDQDTHLVTILHEIISYPTETIVGHKDLAGLVEDTGLGVGTGQEEGTGLVVDIGLGVGTGQEVGTALVGGTGLAVGTVPLQGKQGRGPAKGKKKKVRKKLT
ncbi:hypothetical protein E2C01_031804 [Portunus trituberculatus]|uniref:Uncharacterized protein n=1 Tax=Portunus trituberculatus TaxID=210409 RepID=A0A5B7EZ60_PORTR|nr:hypothetical protein [Portunus trituberculatus]